MTKLLEQAIETARELPSSLQDEIARLMLTFVGEDLSSNDDLSPEDEIAVMCSRRAAEQGDFASEDQMRSLRAKHGL